MTITLAKRGESAPTLSKPLAYTVLASSALRDSSVFSGRGMAGSLRIFLLSCRAVIRKQAEIVAK